MATKKQTSKKRKKPVEIEVRRRQQEAKVIQMLQRPDGATLEA